MTPDTLIYISGKMTGGDTEDPTENFKRFFAKEKELRAIGFHKVINPACLEAAQTMPYEWYIARDIHILYWQRPTLYMMTNWRESMGARIERAVAQKIGLSIVYEEDE